MTLPHYANLRDGELVREPRRPVIYAFCIGALLTASLFILDPLDAIERRHPDCTKEKC